MFSTTQDRAEQRAPIPASSHGSPLPDRSAAATQVIQRQARALRILNCLQSGPSFNARELAEQMNVSRRTIYRDLNLIREAGIRVDFDEQQSGYRIITTTGSDVVPPRLSRADLAKLVLGAHLSLLNGFTKFAGPFRESLAQLLNHSAPDVRESIVRLINSCEVDLPTPRYSQQQMQLLDALLAAITRGRMLRIQVQSREADRPRWTRLAPYRITGSLNRWSVTGRSTVERRTVTFTLDEILQWEDTADPYTIPRGFRHRSRAG